MEYEQNGGMMQEGVCVSVARSREEGAGGVDGALGGCGGSEVHASTPVCKSR